MQITCSTFNFTFPAFIFHIVNFELAMFQLLTSNAQLSYFDFHFQSSTSSWTGSIDSRTLDSGLHSLLYRCRRRSEIIPTLHSTLSSSFRLHTWVFHVRKMKTFFSTSSFVEACAFRILQFVRPQAYAFSASSSCARPSKKEALSA